MWMLTGLCHMLGKCNLASVWLSPVSDTEAYLRPCKKSAVEFFVKFLHLNTSLEYYQITDSKVFESIAVQKHFSNFAGNQIW